MPFVVSVLLFDIIALTAIAAILAMEEYYYGMR